MERKTDKYAEFVDHPRYGRRPKITRLNPSLRDQGVSLHWNTLERGAVVANTAIAADLTRQLWATVAVTHYFDLVRKCRDCGRQFIFFAAEQKHWYEELGFRLESDCVRCVACRKQQQGIARHREIFESLYHIPERTVEQSCEMAEACLSLLEAGEFTRKQTERVRMLLNEVPEDADVRKRSRYENLMKRVIAIEQDVNPSVVDPNGLNDGSV